MDKTDIVDEMDKAKKTDKMDTSDKVYKSVFGNHHHVMKFGADDDGLSIMFGADTMD